MSHSLLLAAVLVAGVAIVAGAERQWLIAALIGGALAFGVLFVLPIGGADMPVVISLLNAFPGLAAAAAGFALDNVALIVAGTLVGSSGTILTLQMSEAMNRSIANILFAGFGGGPAAGAGAAAEDRSYRSTSAAD